MSDATPLRVEEIGSLETTSVSTGSSFSADGVLIVVVPGHTYIPPSGLEDLCDQLQLLLPEDMVWVPNMRKMPDGVQAALKEDDLDFAALQLAQEVSAKVDAIEKEIGKSFALSFWCLGTGGLIARAALAWLTSRREKLLTFISLGTPHLGLFLPGLSWWYWWRVALWRSCSSSPLWLEQVMHMEGRRARGSRLHRLCQSGNFLECFKKLVFIGSGADSLVPLSSSALDIASCDASKAPEAPCPDFSQAVPSSRILFMFLPMLWLARLRAWSSLLAVLIAILFALLLPPLPGNVGRRLTAVKMQLHDFLKTVRGEVEPELDRHFAQLLVSSVAEKLVKVEVWPDKSWRSWWLGQGFGSHLLSEHEWIKTLVQRYGPSLTTRKVEKPKSFACRSWAV
eukprot:s965_g11.t1